MMTVPSSLRRCYATVLPRIISTVTISASPIGESDDKSGRRSCFDRE